MIAYAKFQLPCLSRNVLKVPGDVLGFGVVGVRPILVFSLSQSEQLNVQTKILTTLPCYPQLPRPEPD